MVLSIYYYSRSSKGELSMTVHVNNESVKLEKGEKSSWYKWKVFIDEKDEKLDEIANVTYILHPTFPDPVKVVSDRKSKFALEQIGWGEFNIISKIKYKNGHEEEKSYWLDLSKEPSS